MRAVEYLLRSLLLVSALVPAIVAGQQRPVQQPDFFPFAVWYSGGTARAPMLSELTPASRDAWPAA